MFVFINFQSEKGIFKHEIKDIITKGKTGIFDYIKIFF